MSLTDLPDEVFPLLGVRRHVREASFPAERGHGIASCASVHNANPLFWDDDVAERLTGGPILPPTTLTLWSRPHSWDPVHGSGPAPLPTHFDLKERFGLPEALVSASGLTFLDPVRPGAVMTTGETLRSVSPEKVTARGRGRFWVIEVDYANESGEPVGIETVTGFGYISERNPEPPVTASPPADPPVAPTRADHPGRDPHPPLLLDEVAVGDRVGDLVHEVTASTVVLGAMAARDWRPMHHDPAFARARNGVADVFLDTPTQQAWLERLVTDWTGPTGRLGRLDLRMGRPIVAGATMALSAEVSAVTVDGAGCGWLMLAAAISVGGGVCSRATAMVAVPTSPDDNPWGRRGRNWQP